LVGYERLLDKVILPRLGSVKVRALRPGAIDSFYSDLLGRGGKDGGRLSAQSVQHVHALLRHVLNQGVKWGWLPSNPALRASPPKVRRKEIVTPDPDAVLLLIGEAERSDPDLAVFLRLAAVTGARRGELCALRWSDVDLVAGSVTIARAIVGERNDKLVEKDTKSHAGRRIAIDPQTVDVLAKHRDRCEGRATTAETTLPDRAFVFSPGVTGSRPWRPGGVSLAFIRLRKRAGVEEVPLHSFRHFAATRMLAAGVPVRTVAGRLGHANAATTLNVYSHWVKESDQAAAAILGDLLGNGDKAPTSPPSTSARRTARGAGARPRSGPKGAPQ
jgi:integrase